MAEQMANRQNPPIATLNDFQRLAREFTLACDSRDEVRNLEELYQVTFVLVLFLMRNVCVV